MPQKVARKRLYAVVVGAITAVLITGLIGFFNSQQLSEELEFTDENIIRSLAILSSIERDFLLIRVNALYHLSYNESAQRAPHENTIRHNITQIRRHLEEYERDLVINQQDARLLEQDKRLLDEYLTALNKVLTASNAGQRNQAMQVVEGEWKPAGERLTQAFADHTRYKERLVDQLVQQSMHSGRRNSWILLLVSAAGVLLVLAVAWLFGLGMKQAQESGGEKAD